MPLGWDYEKQPRDGTTGRWYSHNPRWWEAHFRLSTDDRDTLEKLADKLDVSYTDVLVLGLQRLASDYLTAEDCQGPGPDGN